MPASLMMQHSQSNESGTVSPRDLMMDSAPPSASFTDLSTPPSMASPSYNLFSTTASPMFADEAELISGNEEWDSLFPMNNNDSVAAASLMAESSYVGVNMFEGKDEEHNALTVAQQQPQPPSPPSPSSSSSSSSSSRATSVVKPSTVAGVRPRKATKPLPAIKYDPSDPVGAKRARNTQAARKSRQRKSDLQEEMRQRIVELEKQVEFWKNRAEGGS